MKTKTTLVCTCLLLFATSCFAAAPLTTRLPGKCLAYLQWAGDTPALRATALGQLGNSKIMTELQALMKDMAIKQAPDPKAQAMITDATAACEMILRHPAAISLIDWNQDTNGPRPKAVILMDLGKDTDAFAARLENLLQNFGDQLQEESISDTKVRSMQTPVGPVWFWQKDSMFFLCVGEGMPEMLIGMQAEKSLAANKNFVSCMKAVESKDEILSLYVNVVGITAAVKAAKILPPTTDKDITPILEALGVTNVTAIAGNYSTAGPGLHAKLKVFTPAPHRGILMPFAGKPLADSDLSHVPADAVFAAAINMQAEKLLDEFLARLPENKVKGARKGLAKASERFGVDLRKDILANLGDTWVIASADSYGGFLTGTVLSVEAKNPKALEKAIDTVVTKALGGGRHAAQLQMKSGDLTVHYVHILRGRMAWASPAWAVHGNRLYVAIWPQIIVTAVQNQSTPRLTDNKAYQASRAKLAANASALAYVDTPELTRRFYGVLPAAWNMVFANFGREIPREMRSEVMKLVTPATMPPLHVLLKYILPDMAAISSDSTGITFESCGTVGPVVGGPLVPVGAALVIPAVIPTVTTSRWEASSRHNLRSIGTGIKMYEVSHDKMPDSFEDLIREGFIQRKHLISPSSKNKGDKSKPDYIYLAGLTRSAARYGLMCVYERPENHNNRYTLICKYDGSVSKVSMQEFRRRLKETKKAIGKPDAPEKK